MGKEVGGRVRMGNTYMYTLGWFMWMYGKNHHNIVISFQLKKKKKEWDRAWKLIILLCGLHVQEPNDAESGKARRMWPDWELWPHRETPAALLPVWSQGSLARFAPSTANAAP